MKKILTILLIAATASAHAQLKVLANGDVSVGSANSFANTKLSVGTGATPTLFSNQTKGLFTLMETQNDSYTIGHFSLVRPSSENVVGNLAIGMMGVVMPNCATPAFGIHGWLLPNNYGSAVYGSTGAPFLLESNMRYAGFFNGDTRVVGTLTANEMVTLSDIRLKENVIPLKEMESGTSALNKVLNMNVIQYNYIKRQTGLEELSAIEGIDSDIISFVEVENERMATQKHYGLSAQELQQIYPDLVREGQDGYLGINYVELVPILIRSIQELKQELDNVKGSNEDMKMSRSATTVVGTTKTTGNVLYQNTPNPFKEQTTIRFSLADDVQNAAICIFDMTGKMLKKLPISSGETSVSINGWELGEGMFLYTLIVNGREIDTKRMVITK